jgi:hypothetical protein
MVLLGWVAWSALWAGPLCDRLLELQRQAEPALWERAGRPCSGFWKPTEAACDPERLSAELAALISVGAWVLWTPGWIEQRQGALWLLWGLRALALSDALAFGLAM